MKIIGITGKTGSGKSTAAFFLKSALPDSMILDVDSIAKNIYKENLEIVEKLKICFGEEIADCDNNIDFGKLGGIVFSDCSEMKKLDKIMFPLIEKKISEYIFINSPVLRYLIIDAAILFNSNIYKYCNKIILIKSDLKKRRNRLVNKNRNLSETELENRLRNQRVRIIKDKVDFVIENNSGKKDFETKLENIIGSLLD